MIKLDFNKVATYSINDRKNLVTKENFTKPWEKGNSFADFIGSLPSILAGNDIRSVILAMGEAAKCNKQIGFAMGGHVIKTGMSPVIIDLMKRKILTFLAMNGAGIIHDLEIALTGETSEDVAKTLKNGTFGMARETAIFLNQAIQNSYNYNIGLGQAVGQMILDENLDYKNLSLTAAGVKFDIPVTVHVAIGTDIIHMHPNFDAAACGKASHIDFHTFATMVASLEKGVFINAGSAVIMPEIFLKALTLVRNLGYQVNDFTTVNLDFIRHYRPVKNVVERPTCNKGKGYIIIGHHELLIPLIAAGLIETLT